MDKKISERATSESKRAFGKIFRPRENFSIQDARRSRHFFGKFKAQNIFQIATKGYENILTKVSRIFILIYGLNFAKMKLLELSGNAPTG